MLTKTRPTVSPVTTDENSSTFFCDRYYDGVKNVQAWLVDAVVAARDKIKDMSNKALDDLCGFGAERPPGKLPLPRSSVFEKDPTLMNSLVFSLASTALDITIERAIHRRLNKSQKKEIVSYIKTNRLGVWTCGSPGLGKVAPIERAEMFAQLKALNEVDCFVLKT